LCRQILNLDKSFRAFRANSSSTPWFVTYCDPHRRLLCLDSVQVSMRTLLAREKGRNALVDLIQGLPPFRIERFGDWHPVLVRPCSTFHRQESHLDSGQCFLLRDAVLLCKRKQG